MTNRTTASTCITCKPPSTAPTTLRPPMNQRRVSQLLPRPFSAFPPHPSLASLCTYPFSILNTALPLPLIVHRSSGYNICIFLVRVHGQQADECVQMSRSSRLVTINSNAKKKNTARSFISLVPRSHSLTRLKPFITPVTGSLCVLDRGLVFFSFFLFLHERPKGNCNGREKSHYPIQQVVSFFAVKNIQGGYEGICVIGWQGFRCVVIFSFPSFL